MIKTSINKKVGIIFKSYVFPNKNLKVRLLKSFSCFMYIILYYYIAKILRQTEGIIFNKMRQSHTLVDIAFKDKTSEAFVPSLQLQIVFLIKPTQR